MTVQKLRAYLVDKSKQRHGVSFRDLKTLSPDFLSKKQFDQLEAARVVAHGLKFFDQTPIKFVLSTGWADLFADFILKLQIPDTEKIEYAQRLLNLKDRKLIVQLAEVQNILLKCGISLNIADYNIGLILEKSKYESKGAPIYLAVDNAPSEAIGLASSQHPTKEVENYPNCISIYLTSLLSCLCRLPVIQTTGVFKIFEEFQENPESRKDYLNIFLSKGIGIRRDVIRFMDKLYLVRSLKRAGEKDAAKIWLDLMNDLVTQLAIHEVMHALCNEAGISNSNSSKLFIERVAYLSQAAYSGSMLGPFFAYLESDSRVHAMVIADLFDYAAFALFGREFGMLTQSNLNLSRLGESMVNNLDQLSPIAEQLLDRAFMDKFRQHPNQVIDTGELRRISEQRFLTEEHIPLIESLIYLPLPNASII